MNLTLLRTSHDNAERNAVGASLALCLPEHEPPRRYPIVVAKILASALDALTNILAARVVAGGRITLSGILKGQEDELPERYAAWFDELRDSRKQLYAHRRRTPSLNRPWGEGGGDPPLVSSSQKWNFLGTYPEKIP